MKCKLQGSGLRPLRGPTASHQAENRIENAERGRKLTMSLTTEGTEDHREDREPNSVTSLFLAEHFGSKCLDGRAPEPCVGGKSRLTAGLLQERDATPMMFGRDLRQQ